MTGPAVDTHLDQMYFGWRPNGGLVTLASSYFSPDDTDRWFYRLKNYLRLMPMPGAEVPQVAFSYLCFRDDTGGGNVTALVRRINVGASDGRNNSQALIGSAEVLDFTVVVGTSLAPWNDRTENGHIGQVPASRVQEFAANSDDLLSIVHRHYSRVTAVLAGLLADPTAPLSVIGADEGTQLAIVWALHEIGSRYLRRRFAGRDWSFSTYEARHDTGAGPLPGIVFLPVAQPNAGPVSRVVVDLQKASRASDADLAQAEHVVNLLLNDLEADDGVDDRQLQARPQPAPQQAAAPEPPADNGAMPAPRPVPAPPAAPAPPAPVAALLKARNLYEFATGLQSLQESSRWAPMFPSFDVGVVDDLTRYVEVNVRNELLDRLQEIFYGEGKAALSKSPDAAKHAAKLIRHVKSEQLAIMLGTAAPATESVRRAAFGRWKEGAGRQPSAENGKLARQWRGARRTGWVRWAVGGVALVMLGLVFLVGLLTGHRADAAAPAPTPATSAPKPSTTKPRTESTPTDPSPDNQATTDPGHAGDGQASGGAATRTIDTQVGQDLQVWTFHRMSPDHYITIKMCTKMSDTSWLCPSAGDGQTTYGMAVPALRASGFKLDGGDQVSPGKGWGDPQRIETTQNR